jgi:hypothetical protein
MFPLLSQILGGAVDPMDRYGPHHIAVSVKMADIDKWIDIAKECKYLPENDLKVINSLYSNYCRPSKNINCVQII